MDVPASATVTFSSFLRVSRSRTVPVTVSSVFPASVDSCATAGTMVVHSKMNIPDIIINCKQLSFKQFVFYTTIIILFYLSFSNICMLGNHSPISCRTVFKYSYKLVKNQHPIPNRLISFLFNFCNSQINRLSQCIIIWE